MENPIEAWTISFKEHLLLSFKKNIYEILDDYSNVSKPSLQIGLIGISNTLKKIDVLHRRSGTFKTSLDFHLCYRMFSS